ncbi:alpha/beta hydrolase [Rhodothalassium salexigens]|uniref:alpha/beta hydrolase n=1 Tax=Rhodothalassium salexigens TaxID=1086 RepID=UPI00191218BD|nr:alpha/beta hydrolase [Rhodothalassium salexigens]MBK5911618.1 alpha/beta hydrolase [Rhodothalassium salexigens]MBK5920911.1 alpha/beta hydrolase [Rhodothalassium salexigens]
MPDIIFNGPDGRLEGRHKAGASATSPVALILHPHPQYGGTMNNRLVYMLYHAFAERGFAVMRFNFRGVGRSQGEFDGGTGELSDAASALDWMQTFYPNAQGAWIGGFSFGAWIAMQLLMRRPEVQGFISVSPPANNYDFSFLAPCPSSGLIVNGATDDVVPPNAVSKLVTKLRQQKAITIDHEVIEGAGHFYEEKLDRLNATVGAYLDRRLAEPAV